MSEKKRKRQESRVHENPRKKAALDDVSPDVKVSVIEDGDPWAPVLGE
jgi:hypothetical protein